jgi:hypothetical protein
MRVSVSLPPGAVHADDDGSLDTHQFMDVSDAAYRTAHNYPGGIPALAVRMGVLASTLNSKVSVNNTTHHLTLREAVTMQEVTGDTAVLQAMASELGYNCVPSLPANTDDPISLHWQMVSAIGELEHAVADAFQAGVTRNAMRRCDGLAADAISHINNLLAALRAKVPAPPKSQH